MNIDLSDEGTGVMLRYVFNEASTYIEYKRARYNIIDVLSEVGSLYNPVQMGGYIFTMTFSYNLMMSSIIRKLYSFNARFESEIKDRKKKKKKKRKENNTEGSTNNQADSGDDDENDLH